MLNILITGGAGYIGNILNSYLLDSITYNDNSLNINKITVLDNLIHRQHAILDCCSHPNFKFVYGDVRDKPLYKSLINNNDVIINLAAYVGMPLCNRYPNETIQVNKESVQFLAENSSSDQHIIYTTTNSGYGLGQHIDGKAVYCTEETPLNPISLYGETKCAGEKYLMEKGNTTSFRLATVMGVSRKMRMDLLVNDFVWRAWNDKFIVLFESHFLRNFVHVKDVSRAIYTAIAHPTLMRGEVYNVGDTKANVNKRQLCEAIKKQVPDFFITESEINKDPDQRNYIVSNDKIEKTGWLPAFSLDDAIHEVLKICPIIKNTNYYFTDL